MVEEYQAFGEEKAWLSSTTQRIKKCPQAWLDYVKQPENQNKFLRMLQTKFQQTKKIS